MFSGGAVHERDGQLECCGDETAGEPFDRSSHFCCSWPFGKEYVVHDKEDFVSKKADVPKSGDGLLFSTL